VVPAVKKRSVEVAMQPVSVRMFDDDVEEPEVVGIYAERFDDVVSTANVVGGVADVEDAEYAEVAVEVREEQEVDSAAALGFAPVVHMAQASPIFRVAL